MTNEEAKKWIIAIKDKYIHGGDEAFDESRREALDMGIKALEERPTGEWIKGREISRTMLSDTVLHIEYKDYTCSNCGLVLDNLLYNYDGSPFYKYCPNCGAKMIIEDINYEKD